MAQRGAHEETIAALNAMEENLLHLGLGHDHSTAPEHAIGRCYFPSSHNHINSSTAGGSGSATDSSTHYMDSIRKAKEERRRLRVEGEYRRYAAAQQEEDSARTISRAVDGQAARAAIVDGAAALLRQETSGAAAAVRARETAAALDVARGGPAGGRLSMASASASARQPLVGVSAGVATATATLPTGYDCSSLTMVAATDRLHYEQHQPQQHTDPAVTFCADIAAGLAELAVRVSDNRFLSNTTTDLAGSPVRRTRQDLSVTAWRSWVAECVWARALPSTAGTAVAAALVAKNGTTIADPRTGAAVDAETADELYGGEVGSVAHRQQLAEALSATAEAHLTFAAEQQQRHEARLGADALEACAALRRQEGSRRCRAALDELRRQDEDRDTAVGNVAAPIEEMYPGWAQRMPPAGSFVMGDDLSGTRLLSECVERAFQTANCDVTGAAGDAAAAPAPPAAATNRRGSRSAVEESTTIGGGNPALFGVPRKEGGLERIYVTPRTLLNHFPASGAGPAAVGRGHSAGRGRSGGKSNAASVGGSVVTNAAGTPSAGAAGTAGVAGCAGGGPPATSAALSNGPTGSPGGAPSSPGGITAVADSFSGIPGARGVSGDDSERKELEPIVDALCRELLAVHVHNLHIGTNGRVPATLSTAAAAAAAATTANPAAAASASVAGSGAAIASAAGAGKGSDDKAGSQRRQGGSGKHISSPSQPEPVSMTAQDNTDPTEPTPPSPPPLPRTIVLVDFPASEVFFQSLQRRIDTAVGAAESAILWHGELQRLADEAAERASQVQLQQQQQASQQQPQQQQQAVLSASRGQRRRSTSPQSVMPGGAKGKGGASNAKGGAADPSPAPPTAEAIAELRQRTAFPPLCLMGCFVSYDLVERGRRLRGAYTRSLGSMGISGVALHHDVYSPEVLIIGGAGASGSRDGGSGTGGGSSRISSLFAAQAFAKKAAAIAGLETAAINTAANVAATAATRGSLSAGRGESAGNRTGWVREWSVSEFREELMAQQARAAQLRACFPYTTALQQATARDTSSCETGPANGGGGGAGSASSSASMASTAAKKRRKLSVCRGSGAADSSAVSDHASHPSQQLQHLDEQPLPLHTGLRSVASCSRELCWAAAAEVTMAFPKSLFFICSCPVSRAEKANSVVATETPLYPVREGRRCTDTARAYAVATLCESIAKATTPSATRRVLTNETVAQLQLPAPLRLSDYRRSPRVCAALVHTYLAFTTSLGPACATTSVDSATTETTSATAATGAVTQTRRQLALLANATDRTACLRAQMEVLRAVSLFAFSVYREVAHNAFPASLWSGPSDFNAGGTVKGATATGMVVPELAGTLHFSSIDDSYEGARARVAALYTEARRALQERSLVWWRHTRNAALDSAAAVLRLLVAEVAATMHGGSATHSDTISTGVDVGALFLEEVSTPDPAHLAALAALFTTGGEDGEEESSGEGSTGSGVQMGTDSICARIAAVHRSDAQRAHAAAIRALQCVFNVAASTEVAALPEAPPTEPRFVRLATGDTEVNARVDWQALVPALVTAVLAKTFAASTTGGTETVETSAASNTNTTADVSPYLAHWAVSVDETLRSVHEAAARAAAWLRATYAAALRLPPGSSLDGTGARPSSVRAFFGPLPEVTSTTICTVKSTPSAADSPWQRLNLALHLSAFSLYGSPQVDASAFAHALVLTQLPVLWPYLPDASAALAAAVAAPAPTPLDYRSFTVRKVVSLTASEVAAGDALWMHTLLATCSCRAVKPPETTSGMASAGDMQLPPFLSLDELHELFRKYTSNSNDSSSTAKSEGAPRVNVRHFLLDVVLRRCCCCARGPRGCAWQRQWAVPAPSARELRAVIATLPAPMRRQCPGSTAAAEIEHESPEKDSAAASTGNDAAVTTWAGVRWWPLTSPASTPSDAPVWADDASLPVSLLRTLTARFQLGERGCLHQAWPALPEMLRLLAIAEGGPAGTLERAFHGVATLPAVSERTKSDRSQNCDGSSDNSRGKKGFHPAEVDAIRLAGPDFCFYFSALARPHSSRHAGAGTIPLAEDVALLEQATVNAEGAEESDAGGVTLPALVASHWGRALVEAHFA